jgi:hypothetical protein
VVGGVSVKDAGIFAKEMNCEPEFLQNMRKGRESTQFACFVLNHTRRPIALTVPFGQMEKAGKTNYRSVATGACAKAQAVRRDRQESHAPERVRGESCFLDRICCNPLETFVSCL